MEIIGAGWGRTGTMSLTRAFEILGLGEAVHMSMLWEHPDLARDFVEHGHDASFDWPARLSGWRAGVDWPVCWVWQQLAEAQPDAPVLLTTRDPQAWYDSVMASIHPAAAPDRDPGSPERRELLDVLWQRDFGGWERVFDRDHAIECFEAHNASVRAACPPDRLVEWQPGDGWAPLCAALGVDVPDVPFPHSNTRAEFQRRVAER